MRSAQKSLKLFFWLTSNLQIKGIPRLLWAIRTLFECPEHVYPVAHRLRLRLDESQLYQWWYAVNYSAYELTLIFRRLLREGDCMFDVGANIGYTALNAAQLVGSSGTVFAFEPGEETYKCLCENITLNSMKNLECMRLAISSFVGTATFNEASDAGLSRLENNHSNTFGLELVRKVNVKVDTLDNIWQASVLERRVRLIKIDIEGHELAALAGAVRLLNESCDYVICEINEGALAQNGVSMRDIVKYMSGYCFTAWWIQSHSADWFRLGRKPTLTSVMPDDPNRSRGRASDMLFVHGRAADDFANRCGDLLGPGAARIRKP